MAFLKSVMKCSVSKKYVLNLHTFCYSRPAFSVVKRHNSASSAATAVHNDSDLSSRQPRKDPLDTSFNDPEASFKSKTTWEVLRAYLVYTMCSSSTLVENNMKLMKLTKALVGEKLFTQIMKATFYGHFVAGEDRYKIVPTLKRLRSFGVKPILDYSVEEDLSQEEAEKREVESSVSEVKAQGTSNEEQKRRHMLFY